MLERDGWVCQYCLSGKNELQVHHLAYCDDFFATPDHFLITSCRKCHQRVEQTVKQIRAWISDDQRLCAISDFMSEYDFRMEGNGPVWGAWEKIISGKCRLPEPVRKSLITTFPISLDDGELLLRIDPEADPELLKILHGTEWGNPDYRSALSEFGVSKLEFTYDR